MASIRHFGEIDGIKEGATFSSYAEMNQAKIHTPTQAGISGSMYEGADSIVVSGGYEDDQDFGVEIVYTGHGGRNESGKQIADQVLTRGNFALAKNEMEGLPLRVIRGAHKGNPYSPISGYRYDGLYRVDSHWCEIGRSGFKVFRYKLFKLDETSVPAVNDTEHATLSKSYGSTNPKRSTQTIQRVIRDSRLGRELKNLYDYKCQVCNLQIKTDAGFYAEAAHIKPVGSPHNGPDTLENLLCLCPNHHLMFDKGVFLVNDDFSLSSAVEELHKAKLHKVKLHRISIDHLRYHRSMFSKG